MKPRNASELKPGDVVYLRVNPDVVPKGYLALEVYDDGDYLYGKEPGDHMTYNLYAWFSELEFEKPESADRTRIFVLHRTVVNHKTRMYWHECDEEQAAARIEMYGQDDALIVLRVNEDQILELGKPTCKTQS